MPTVNKSAINSSFTLAAEGACLIDLMEPGTVRVWMGSNAPDINVGAYHVIRYNNGGLPYTGTEKVYILSNDGATHLCVVTEV